jgi:hypothetical protein
MTFKIDEIEIRMIAEPDGIRVICEHGNVILPDQTTSVVQELIGINHKIVKDHYAKESFGKIEAPDLGGVSLRIVLSYLYMYNIWRGIYPKERKRDLKFLTEDFEHPQTYDLIIDFFRKKYPEGYSEKCELLMNMTPEKFRDYEKSRRFFHDR